MAPLKILYAHGFASGPLSKKGVAVRDHLAARGLTVELLDLRVPSPSGLRLSAMIDVVLRAAGERTFVIGSSLGGLTCARAAERDPRIVAALLQAPALRFADRWRARMGELDWAKWRREGTFRYEDHSIPGGALDVEFAFMEDVSAVDGGGGDRPVREDAWPNVTVPTTVVHGVRDEVVDPWLSRTWSSTRPNVTLVEVDDDHQLLSSVPVILREIDRMLEKL